jgi:hypothetical protein
MRVLVMIGDDPEASAAVTLEGLAGAYYAVRDAGAEIVLASAGGGAPGVARAAGCCGPAAARFQADHLAREDLADTLRYDQVCLGEFDAILGFRGDPGLTDRALRAGVPVALVGEPGPPARAHAGGLLILVAGDADATRAARALVGAATSPR